MMDRTRIKIDNEEYLFIKDYKDNNKYRQSFNRLAKQVHGIDFENWYQQGYWSEKYRPYSLVNDEEVVANISVNTIDFLIDGTLFKALQIGTVMTEEAYRNRGLSKELMNIVLDEYEKKYEFMYLYANDSVLEFYPRFGFSKTDEFTYSKQFTEKGIKHPYRKLDMKIASDKELVTRLVSNTIPVSEISMVGNMGLDMFYLTQFMSQDIYYLEELDLAVVADFNGEKLFLMDVYCEHEFDLEEVINALVNNTTATVTLGFTPIDKRDYTCELLKEAGTTFFTKGKNIIDKGSFPILSHA